MSNHEEKPTHSFSVAFPILAAGMPGLYGDSISVNFHVGNDADAQADHELTGVEVAGAGSIAGSTWNNINVGNAGAHNTAGPIFASTALADDMGNTNAATLAPSVDSTWFVGYGASAATGAQGAQELGLDGNHDDLFNSYLALNGPSGDGSPADAALLTVSGMGTAYTSGGYTLVIYSDTDKGPVAGNRRSVFTVTPDGGSAIEVFTEDDSTAPAGSTFDGTYVFGDGAESGADYANFTVIKGLTAAGFTLELTSPDGGRGGICGFQIISDLRLTVKNAAIGTNLDFSWNSVSGTKYNLRGSTTLDSDPSTWPIVVPNIDATGSTTNMPIARPGDPKTFYVIEVVAP